jgi:hypothetical protein
MIPLYDATAPVACTLDAAEVPARQAQLERMRAAVAAPVERTADGLILRFPLGDAEVAADVRRFAADEARCCTFWGFEVAEDAAAGALVLTWDGPPSVATIVDQVHEFFLGDAPASAALAGLL